MTFKICRRCGNLVGMIRDSGAEITCCGQPMAELKPNTVEASGEKHVPVAVVADGKVSVNVGSVAHPMLPEHYIEWIALETEQGMHRKRLNPGEAPAATFILGDEKPLAVYAFCNLHGLWKTDL